MADHAHEWERGFHMRQSFGVDGRMYACAICGIPRRAARRSVEEVVERPEPRVRNLRQLAEAARRGRDFDPKAAMALDDLVDDMGGTSAVILALLDVVDAADLVERDFRAGVGIRGHMLDLSVALGRYDVMADD